jgi:hypothetical protein
VASQIGDLCYLRCAGGYNNSLMRIALTLRRAGGRAYESLFATVSALLCT